MTRIRALHLPKITVTAEDGEQRDARLFQCQCRSSGTGAARTWVVFQLSDQDHPHLQCASCGEVYCSRFGGCHAPPPDAPPPDAPAAARGPDPNVVEDITRRVAAVEKDESRIGVFSTGEQIAVALVLDRPDLLPHGGYTWIEAIDRLGREWFEAARAVQMNRE